MALVNIRQLRADKGYIMAIIDTISGTISKFDRPRRLVGLVVLFIAAVLLIAFFSGNTLTKVSFSGDIANADFASYDAASGQKNHLGSLFGLLVVPRSSQALVATSGDAETQISLAEHQLPPIYGKLEVNLQQPKQARLLSSGNQDCPFVVGGSVYSYDCNQPGTISKYDGIANGIPQNSVSETLPSFTYGYQPARYKDGLVVQRVGIGRQLQYAAVYVSPGQPQVVRQLPDTFYSANDYVMMFADNTNSTSNALAIYNSTSGIGYYFKDFLHSSKAIQFKAQHRIDVTIEQSSCVLVGAAVTCYHGIIGELSNVTEPELSTDSKGNIVDTPARQDISKRRGSVEVTDFSSGSASVKSYQGPEGYGIADLYATADGSLYGRNDTKLDKLALDGKSFSSATIANNSATIAAGSQLYYVQDDKVYSYDAASSSSSLIYTSNQESLSGLKAYGNQLFILGYAQKDPAQILHAYQLAGN
jgi:hypothetical protein